MTVIETPRTQTWRLCNSILRGMGQPEASNGEFTAASTPWQDAADIAARILAARQAKAR